MSKSFLFQNWRDSMARGNLKLAAGYRLLFQYQNSGRKSELETRAVFCLRSLGFDVWKLTNGEHR